MFQRLTEDEIRMARINLFSYVFFSKSPLICTRIKLKTHGKILTYIHMYIFMFLMIFIKA